jgi:hypothetical protein
MVWHLSQGNKSKYLDFIFTNMALGNLTIMPDVKEVHCLISEELVH